MVADAVTLSGVLVAAAVLVRDAVVVCVNVGVSERVVIAGVCVAMRCSGDVRLYN